MPQEYLANEIVDNSSEIAPDEDEVAADGETEFLNMRGLIRLMPYLVPPGIVMAYSPSTSPATAPKGWAICDGQNGTPDLRGKFILGSSDTHATGETGGSETHTLSVGELPAHTHTFAGVTLTEDGNGGSLFSGGEDTISPSGSSTTGSTGGGQAFSTMPPYYALVYIMKLAYRDPFSAEDSEIESGGLEETEPAPES